MLHYEKYTNPNSSEWVVFIHGAGGSSSIWYKQLKFFSRRFNVLLIDLRGHGKSEKVKHVSTYTFRNITKDVIEVLDDIAIQKAHFIGISLGTIIIREMAEIQPNRIKSMILGGAIIKLNIKSRVLLKLGVWFKSLLPYMVLYKFFAFVIIPKHKKSRSLFVNEAKKLAQKEFKKWFKLASELKPVLKLFRNVEVDIPTLYVMGDKDYMFLPSVQKVSESHKKSSLFVIENCGHVVNVEKAEVFNHTSINFINSLKNY